MATWTLLRACCTVSRHGPLQHGAVTTGKSATMAEDPHKWLEEVLGDEALKWVSLRLGFGAGSDFAGALARAAVPAPC